MAFAVSYDIKAIDKFTAVAKKVIRSMEAMDGVMRKLEGANKRVAKTFDKVASSSQKASRNASSFGDIMKKEGKRAINAGRDLTTYVTLPVAGMGAASIKAAADFETSMIEIQKVTDKATTKILEKSIRKLTKQLPMTHKEIAQITADAARFGVRGPEHLEKFTVAVAKLSTATDLSSERAGEALAKILELTDLNSDSAEGLGSSINSLANNYATSANEIVTSMLRSGAAASQFGLNAAQIAGVSAQMNAVTESAERAGTRFRTLFQELMNPKKTVKYAKAIGMTAEQFEALRKASPEAALLSLVKAIDDGGEASRELRKIAGGEALQALTAMAKSYDKTKDAIKFSKDEMMKANSVNKELEDVLGTTNAQFKIFWNRVKDISITVGNKLIPVLMRLMDKYIEPIVKKLEGMTDAQLESILKFAAMAAALGPTLLIVGKVTSMIGTIATAMQASEVAAAGKAVGNKAGGLMGAGLIRGVTGAMGVIPGLIIAGFASFQIGKLIGGAIGESHKTAVKKTATVGQRAAEISKSALKETDVATIRKQQAELKEMHRQTFKGGIEASGQRETTREGIEIAMQLLAERRKMLQEGKATVKVEVSAQPGSTAEVKKTTKTNMPNIEVGANTVK